MSVALGFAMATVVFVLIFMLISGVTYYRSQIFFGPILITIVTFFVVWLANSLVVWFGRPVFGDVVSMFPSNGWGMILFWDILIAVAVVAISLFILGYEEYSIRWQDYQGILVNVIVVSVFILLYVVSSLFGATRDGLDPWQYNNWKGNHYGKTETEYGALKVKYDSTLYPPTKSDHLIKVSEATAHLIADRSISQMGVSSYAQVSDSAGYLTKDPQGTLWWVESLSVKDMTAFKNAGATLPGFIMVNAMVKDAPARIVTGHKIQYIPGLELPADFHKDPNTYVYYKYLLGTDMFVHGLTENDNIEIEWDKQGNPQPRFTGVVLQHYKGLEINKPVGVMIFNPENGDVKVISMDERKRREYNWIQHVYPEEDMNNAVTDFGMYGPIIKELNIGHDDTVYQGDKGRVRFDTADYVVTGKGIVRQYVLTSLQADKSATALLYVSPDDLTATIYPLKSAISSTVAKMMEAKVEETTKRQVSIKSLQVQTLNGVTAWYGIVVTDGQGEGNDGAHMGYAFITTANSQGADNASVIYAQTFDAAYSAFSNQIANGKGVPNKTDVSSTATTKVVIGTVDRVGFSPNSTGSYYWYITLREHPGVRFRVSVENEVNAAKCALLQSGDSISMVVQVTTGGDFTDVKSLERNK